MLPASKLHHQPPAPVTLGALGALVAGLTLFLGGCPSGTQTGVDKPKPGDQPAAPIAEAIPHKTAIHGVELVDNYYWLRERDNPKVLAYLEAENRYTEAVMAPTKELRETLFQEMKGRIKEADLSVPTRIDDFWYYTRTEEGKQYWTFCRKKGSLDAPEEVLLDVNQLATGKKFYSIGALAVSPDHTLLLYGADESGNEQYDLQVKNLTTGELLPDVIEKTEGSVEWANDNKTVFYVVRDKAHRPYRVMRHQLGQSGPDAQVFQEDDERFFVGLDKTKDKKYLFIELGSAITSEVHYLDASQPTGTWQMFRPRVQGVEYSVAHHTDWFYIVTNDGAKNFKLMKTGESKLAPEHWQEVIAHSPAVKIDGVDMFRDHMVVYQRKNGLRSLEVWNLSSGERHDIAFDEPVYAAFGASNPEFDSATVRFSYTSMVTPNSVFDYDMNTRTRKLMKQTEVLGGYDSAKYRSERIHATAGDGTRVPISLVYRADMRKPGGNPCLLMAYGSYGFPIDPYFSSSRLSLLDRGFVYAIAHIRGGGEMGRLWYEDGKLLKKKNTFTDFIAAMEHLIASGYTTSEWLAITGGSAGGLLIGAVLNMRPDLMKAAIADVPFVDVINTMLDTSIPLTVTEFEEWGNPQDKPYFDYMRSYSPYDNVEAKDYPHILITAGLNDPRVQYWEPAKWTARLRALKTDSNRLLLRTNMGAGHGGSSGRFDRLREVAFDYAFILDVFGMAK